MYTNQEQRRRLAMCVGRQALSWISLLVLSSTTAYALDAALVAVPAVETTAPATTHTTNVVEQSVGLEHPPVVVVDIAFRDPTTGAEIQVPCVTASDRVTTDVLQVNADEVPDLLAKLCGGI